jgi:hypothetical protein
MPPFSQALEGVVFESALELPGTPAAPEGQMLGRHWERWQPLNLQRLLLPHLMEPWVSVLIGALLHLPRILVLVLGGCLLLNTIVLEAELGQNSPPT